MAALNRPVTATYAVNETVRVDTQGTKPCREREQLMMIMIVEVQYTLRITHF